MFWEISVIFGLHKSVFDRSLLVQTKAGLDVKIKIENPEKKPLDYIGEMRQTIYLAAFQPKQVSEKSFIKNLKRKRSIE